jgi:hypothetical protein
VLKPDSKTGDLGKWSPVEPLKLPEARSDTSLVVTADGLLLIGGKNATGPVATTWKTKLDAQGQLGKWAPEQSLLAPQADATAVLVGDFVWLYGGVDANGPVTKVQRGAFGQKAAAGLPANPNEGKLVRWDVNDRVNLPAARTNTSGWTANGAIYLGGGSDGQATKPEVYWAVPTTTGDLPEWKHLASSDLPATGLEGAAAVISGPEAIMVGGKSGDEVRRASVRANTAPQSPFFQVGLVGATVPGLKIEGEIGQQLGYLNAAGVGTVDFVILLLIGWAYAHREQTRAMFARVMRRRERRRRA